MTKPEEIEILIQKIESIASLGVSQFALLMDDIDYELKGDSLHQFKTPGIAHASLANEVYSRLLQTIPNLVFTICPTEYAQNWDTPYRQDLNHYLDSRIQVFFTGYNTIAKSIPFRDIELVYQSFGHSLAIWDNYPTNDVNRDRLFLTELRNRFKKGNKRMVNTYIANPMNQWNASKLALVTMSKFMWSPSEYEEETAFEEALDEMSFDYHIKKENLRFFARLNADSRLRHDTFEEFQTDIDKEHFEPWLTMCNETLIQFETANQALLKEITPWVDHLKIQTKLLDAASKKEQMEPRESIVHFGFDFGTYAHRRKG